MKLYTTGPALCFAGVGGTPGARSPLVLGTCQQAPQIELIRAYTPVMNDLAGQVLPMDEIWQGERAIISLPLNRFQLATVLRMQSLPNFNGLPGQNTSIDIGTAMAQEGNTWPFYMVFPYATGVTARASMNNDLMPGYRFWSCKLVDADKIKPGTTEMSEILTIQADRAYTGSNDPLQGTMVGGSPGPLSALNLAPRLYDFNIAAVNNVTFT